jgi:hypothetical protein
MFLLRPAVPNSKYQMPDIVNVISGVLKTAKIEENFARFGQFEPPDSRVYRVCIKYSRPLRKLNGFLTGLAKLDGAVRACCEVRQRRRKRPREEMPGAYKAENAGGDRMVRMYSPHTG